MRQIRIEITEQEIKDLKLVRNYFGMNDRTQLEHLSYHLLDRLIEKFNKEENATNKTCWSCGITISYHENGKPHYHCVCGAVDPASCS